MLTDAYARIIGMPIVITPEFVVKQIRFPSPKSSKRIHKKWGKNKKNYGPVPTNYHEPVRVLHPGHEKFVIHGRDWPKFKKAIQEQTNA